MLRDGLKRAGQALAQLYPKGLSLFWVAPLALALVVVPQFIQHVVEIRLGMFEGLDAFRAHQLDATRMTFGAAKVAGLFLAFFAAARAASTLDRGGRWWDLRDLAWGRLALGAFIFLGIGSLPELLRGRMDDSLHWGFSLVWTILLLPALFMLLSGLFGDRKISVPAMWRSSWPWAPLIVLLLILAFAPAQWLHQMNHDWALGAEPALLWGLMIFDSLLVGLLAALTGTALYLGYAAFAQGEGKRDPSAAPTANRAI